MVKLERFCDEVSCAPLDRFDRAPHASKASNDDPNHIWVQSACAFYDLGAIDARETEVGNQCIEGKVRYFLQGIFTRPHLNYVIAVFLKPLCSRFAESNLVFDKE